MPEKKLKFVKSSLKESEAKTAAGSDGIVRQKEVGGKTRYFAFKKE